jgi:hypothetical protein
LTWWPAAEDRQNAQDSAQHPGSAAPDFPQHTVEVELRQSECQRAGGCGLQVMSLIHDQVCVFRKNFALSRHIRQQQGMIDDE